MESIYLDYAATTPLRAEVRDAMVEAWADFGNPSSVHSRGRRTRHRLEEARERLASVLGARRREIIFTGGGTEANNLAVLGRWRAWRRANDSAGSIACSAVEHSAVLAPMRAAAREGAELLIMGVTDTGRLDTGALDEVIEARPALISVMWANNEVGTIQPVAEIAERCRDTGIAFHSDAIQAFGRERIRMDEVACSLLSLSAHKIGGPTGIGALFVRGGTELEPLVHGGGQEEGLRPGTEPVAAAVGFALAAELAERERDAEANRLARLRDRLEAGLLSRVPGARVNGDENARLPQILSISIPDIDREALLMSLDLEGIAASSGSACKSGATEPSHVLVAMGRDSATEAPLRLSLGYATTESEIDIAIERIASVVGRVRLLAGA